MLLNLLKKLRRKYYSTLLKRDISDKEFYEIQYKMTFGKNMNWNSPKTFNEKIQHRKLFDRDPIYTLCSDKYRVRKFIKEKGFKDILIPLYDKYEGVEDIDFSKLPKEFVIKTNHDSGSIEVVRDKEDINVEDIKYKFQKSLNNNYYSNYREWQYKDIKPLIIVEKLLYDEDGSLPLDFKFHCFNGKVEMIQVANETHTGNNIYDTEWKLLPFEYLNRNFDKDVKKPKGLSKMIQISEEISYDFNYVRVDLYNIKGQIYFGELTFTPNGGFGKFKPKKFDKIYGDKFSIKIYED